LDASDLQGLGGMHRRQPQASLPEVSAGGFGGATQAAEDLKTFEARQICVNFRLKWEKWKSGWENIYENGWENPPFLS